MNVLVACEESQAVCKEFRRLGHNAFSCDIQPCSGGHTEWHILDDVSTILEPWDHGNNTLPGIWFTTVDGTFHEVENWDLIIAFPPCTDLAVSGARWFEEKRKDGRQQKSIDFFMQFTKLDCPRVAIENPIGIMSVYYRKPDQIIQPYMFGHPCKKSTCLWLKGLQKLKATNIVEPDLVSYICKNGKRVTFSKHYVTGFKSSERATARSKTFPGIARAMAEQWSDYLTNNTSL